MTSCAGILGQSWRGTGNFVTIWHHLPVPPIATVSPGAATLMFRKLLTFHRFEEFPRFLLTQLLRRLAGRVARAATSHRADGLFALSVEPFLGPAALSSQGATAPPRRS